MAKAFEAGLWAGTDESLQLALKAEQARVTRIEAGSPWEGDEDLSTRLLEVRGNIGIISIKGSLNNDDDARWNSIVGSTGYPEIANAMIAAAEDPNVKTILMDVGTGGGSVNGLEDTSELIRKIDASIKPVYGFTSDAAYSAGYWLLASAREVNATKSAGLGSIGVIATHVERSDQLKADGLGVTVVRAGKYKALANGVEKLSDEGRAQIQEKVDSYYQMFVEHVADRRGKSYEYADTVMAQGREFNGKQALDVGLVDNITTFDALINKLNASIDKTNQQGHTRTQQSYGLRTEHEDSVMARKNLTEQDIAAIAAGASLEAVVSPDAPVVEAAVEPESTETLEAVAPATETVAEVDTSASTLKFVSEQLKSVQAELLAAQIKASKLEDKLAEVEAVVAPLKDIAAKAVNNMRIACRASNMDLSAMSAAQVLAEYTAIMPTFTNQFKAGGVAAVDAAQDQGKKVAWVPDSLINARINAVRGK